MCSKNKEALSWLNVMGRFFFILVFGFFCTNLMFFAPSAHVLMVVLGFHCK